MQPFADIGSAAQAIERAYARIAALQDNPAFIHVAVREQAIAQADEVDPSLPLAGVPFAVKDNIDVAGMPTTAACPAFAYQPQRSATAVQRLLDAGAIPIGKTNLDQFATGLVGTRSPYGACRNVHDGRYISGGSSSGSAVAVAAGVVPFALGTDTAGSGRVPAALMGLVGFKPTRGRISTAGVIPACRSLDCVSILARCAAEALAVFDVAAGFDPHDPFSRRPLDLALRTDTVALPRAPQFFGDAAYERLFAAAAERMEALGTRLVEIDFQPFLEVQALLYEGPWLAERVAAVGAFMAESPQALHPVTRRVLEPGMRYSAVDAFRGQHRLAELRLRCTEALQGAEVLLVPGAPGIYTLEQVEANPFELNARLGLYTNFANLLDLAAVTVPAGSREDGLPFGVTLLGPAFTDRALARLAARFLDEAIPDEVGLAPARIRLAVAGAHLSGMPLNGELVARGARLLRAARTAAAYRLYALGDQRPARPGLVRVPEGLGAAIEVEVWDLEPAGFAGFVAGVGAPLAIGTLELEDGERVKGFVCEGWAVAGQEDISAFGGWRGYLESRLCTHGEAS